LRFALYLAIAFLALSFLMLWPNVFRVTGHEVDLIQALDISYRMIDGLVPHVDFLTPLGVLAFQPITWFLETGLPPGRSFLLAQVAVTAIMLPGIWWVGMSRLEGGVRLLYGLGMVVLGLAMIFGGANPAISASMYYNRWAWIPASFIVLMLLLPPRGGWRSDWADGVLLGLSGGVLVLTKVTFVIALIPFALTVILAERRWRLLGVALVAMLVVMGWATLTYGGIGYWQAYIGDLLVVATESRRTNPGTELGDLVASPKTFTMTALLLVVIVFWRRSRMRAAGLAMLLLAPGFIYITYQNWGNDPKWLFVLAIVLLTRLPPTEARAFLGVPPQGMSRVLALICIVLYAPSMMNLATSTMRHTLRDAEATTPLFRDLARDDIMLDVSRVFTPRINVPIEGEFDPEGLLDAAQDSSGEDDEDEEPVLLLGEPVQDCTLDTGLMGWTWKVVEQLGAVEEAVGKRVIVADMYDHLYLFGPFARNDGMAPWYYGTDRGFDGVDYILVPHCPLTQDARADKLRWIEKFGWTLEEVVRTDLFTLVRRAD
ncbi:MAG: hypothetical protein AAGE38_14440, partial [Pseudomonadota bacterium]